MLRRLGLCRPIVGFGLERATPGKERVVHDHAVREHFVVVRKVRGEAKRNREQPPHCGARSWRDVSAAAHDGCEMISAERMS